MNAVYDTTTDVFARSHGKSWDEVPGQTGSGKKFHRNVISGADFAADVRHVPRELEVMPREWESLNAKAEPVCKHLDGHCHEGVMWYVHHLPESLKEVITDKASLPVLSQIRHDLSLVKLHTVRVQRAYEEKITCTSSREWESLKAKAELAPMHRDRHCHEAMVLYRPPSRCKYPVENKQSHAGESYQRATTQGPIREREFTHISRAGNPKRKRPNCHNKTPRCRGVGTPSWTGPLTTSLRGLWVSGYLSRAMADRAKGRRPENRPRNQGG